MTNYSGYPGGVPPTLLKTIEQNRRMVRAASPAYSLPNTRHLTEAIAQATPLQKTVVSAHGQPFTSAGVQQALQHATRSFATLDWYQPLQEVARAYAGTTLQHTLQTVARMYAPSNFAAVLRQSYAQHTLRLLRDNIGASLTHLAQVAASDAWARAAEDFKAELEASGDVPVGDEEPDISLGWWLATRPLVIQLGLLHAALVALEKGTRALEEHSGQEISDSLQATIGLLLAVSFFILLYLQERDKAE